MHFSGDEPPVNIHKCGFSSRIRSSSEGIFLPWISTSFVGEIPIITTILVG